MGFDELMARAWPIFLEAIRQRRTLTYTELAGRIGPPATARAIHRQLLRPLSARCERWALPDLPALVVRKSSGVPGGGWFDPPKPGEPESPDARWAAGLQRCLDHDWAASLDPRLLIDPERKHLVRSAGAAPVQPKLKPKSKPKPKAKPKAKPKGTEPS